jgi:hypothetical protein
VSAGLQGCRSANGLRAGGGACAQRHGLNQPSTRRLYWWNARALHRYRSPADRFQPFGVGGEGTTEPCRAHPAAGDEVYEGRPIRERKGYGILAWRDSSYSGLMPALRTTLPHFSVSTAIKAPNS